MLGLPYVVKAHGTDVNVVARWRSVRPLVASAVRSASYAIAVSRPMAELLTALGAPPGRAVVVRNGVDRSIFHPSDRLAARRELGLPERGRIITFVGELKQPKGILDLLEAFETLAEERGEPTHLVVVGAGPARIAVDRAAARRKADRSAAGQIIAAGERPLREVARYMAAADLLTLPSWAEGTPNVVLEAMTVGCPVVATSVGGIPDLVTHGRTGLLVPPRDVRALGQALREALARPWDARAFAEAAPPSWEESAEVLERLLARAAFGDSERAVA